jgi:hypothetical protein
VTDETGDGRDAPTSPQDEVGPLAEEAAKLFGALGDWARDQGGQVGSAFGDLGEAATARATDWAQGVDDHVTRGAAECQWCPLCRTVHTVRQLSPEVKAHLTSAATSLAQAAAALMATPPPSRRERPGGSGVERIELDGEPPADEAPEGEPW